MCTCHLNVRCPCYRDAQEHREERARQAHASKFEHEILAALRGDRAGVAPRVAAFVKLLRAQPESGDGANVRDILVTGGGVHYWLAGDGAQRYLPLAARPAITLVA